MEKQVPDKASEQNKTASHNASNVPINVRVMLALIGSPTLAVIAYFIYNLSIGAWQSITPGMLIFSVIGGLIYYLVIFGRLPRFRKVPK
ncbi:MAG: hypothetical protein GW763_13880 [Paraglaciecola sp.]|nr:hypothetical protein [Paraglaciecola sp.]NCT49043.1 hypothetical protein [Paraglaciecola sp.]